MPSSGISTKLVVAKPSANLIEQGQQQAERGQFESAIETYQIGRFRPTHRDAEAYRYRGLAYHDLGNYPQAIDDFSTALQIHPDHPETLYLRGEAYSHTQDVNAALSGSDAGDHAST